MSFNCRGIPNEKLRQLLRYMEESIRENAVNEELVEVHRIVEIVKTDPETTISCMRLIEKLDQSKNKGLGSHIRRPHAGAVES